MTLYTVAHFVGVPRVKSACPLQRTSALVVESPPAHARSGGDIGRRRWGCCRSGTPAAPNVTYCYDGQIAGSQDGVCVAASPAIPNSRGRLTQMRSSASTTTYSSYDGLGRVTQSSQITGTTTYPFSYAYNAAGLLTRIFPGGYRTFSVGVHIGVFRRSGPHVSCALARTAHPGGRSTACPRHDRRGYRERIRRTGTTSPGRS